MDDPHPNRTPRLGRLAVLAGPCQRGVQLPAGADAELGKYLAQAIACTLDRPAIVQALFQGYADVGNDTPFAPAFPATIGPPAIPQRSKNLKLAKELLAKGGVPNGFSAPLLTEALAEMPDFAYDQLSKEFVATPDLTTQRRLAGQIERLLLDETPIIYAYFYDWLVATQKDITGVYPAITGLFLWNAART